MSHSLKTGTCMDYTCTSIQVLCTDPLIFVPPLPDHQFSNGCHAPPWQQVHGDISYLDVKPFDSDKLTITANTAGYFLNKGLTQEGQVNYERDGEVYPTLVALLKAKSPQFASAIEKKV